MGGGILNGRIIITLYELNNLVPVSLKQCRLRFEDDVLSTWNFVIIMEAQYFHNVSFDPWRIFSVIL
jgi:hypothetical protein